MPQHVTHFHFALYLQAQTFEKVISSDTEGSDEKAISAMGILNTLDAIITVMEDQKEVGFRCKVDLH